MSISTSIKRLGIEQAVNYLYKDPEKNLRVLMDWADKFCNGEFGSQRRAIRHAIEDPNDPYYGFIRHMIQDVDHEVLSTIAVSFFINANLIGWPIEEEARKKYGCNIPWAILLDPTSACNLHCTGCWAAEYGNKLNLSFDEIDSIVEQGKKLGVYMYIYTGGEPLVRKGVEQLVKGLKAIPGIRKVTMTTNAVLLEQQLPALLEAGLDSVNISLDTLRPEVFQRITARDEFSHVMEGLRAALDSGIPVKLNCVPQAGVNEGELEDLAALAEAHPLQVRFIEMMPIGFGKQFPFQDEESIKAVLEEAYGPMHAVNERYGNGPCHYYEIAGFKGKIGFISAMTHKFCSQCNRVRLTSEGFMKGCLQYQKGTDLRGLMRGGCTDSELKKAIYQVIWNKPVSHNFYEAKTEQDEIRGMSQIGG